MAGKWYNRPGMRYLLVIGILILFISVIYAPRVKYHTKKTEEKLPKTKSNPSTSKEYKKAKNKIKHEAETNKSSGNENKKKEVVT